MGLLHTTIHTAVPGWLVLDATGRVHCVPAQPTGPIALGPALTCDHELAASCSCELDLPGDPELRLDLRGTGEGVRPSVALHVRGDGTFVDADERTVFGRRRLSGVAVSLLCDDCLDTRGGPRFAAGLVATSSWPSLLVPLCREHADGRKVLSVQEIDRRCALDVVGAAPSHALVRALLVDHDARYPQPMFPIDKRYVTDLTVGQSARIFAEHIRVDADGRLRLATWTRVLPGVPSVDVPVRRHNDGSLEVDLTDIRLKRPIRHLTDRDVEKGFTIDARRVGAEPIAPTGREAFETTAE